MQIYAEERRATEMELEKEIEGGGHHPAGTMSLEQGELASPPGSRNQRQKTCKEREIVP